MFAMMLRQKKWHVTIIEKSKIFGGGVRPHEIDFPVRVPPPVGNYVERW